MPKSFFVSFLLRAELSSGYDAGLKHRTALNHTVAKALADGVHRRVLLPVLLLIRAIRLEQG